MTETNDIEWLASLIDTDDLSYVDRQRLRALKKDPITKAPEGPFYGVVAWGNEGLEMFLISPDIKDLTSRLKPMEVRCRFNGHRNIKMYAFSCESKVDWDMAEKSEGFKALIEKKGTRLY